MGGREILIDSIGFQGIEAGRIEREREKLGDELALCEAYTICNCIYVGPYIAMKREEKHPWHAYAYENKTRPAYNISPEEDS